IRVAVLSGKGNAFCAGADLKELMTDLESKVNDGKGILDQVTDLLDILNKFKKPLIAALNGITLAGGLEIAMAADIIIATNTAKIGDAHANFGIIPGGGGAVR